MTLSDFFENLFSEIFAAKKLVEAEEDIAKLNVRIEELTSSLKKTKEAWASILGKNAEKLVEIQALKEDIAKLKTGETPIDPNEKYWNEKYPKQDIKYSRKEYDSYYDIDVRNYYEPYDSTIPTVPTGGSYDDRALLALKWVKENITYVKDKAEFGLDEFWCRAYQTLKHRKGDCEDGAILLANILLRSGVPYWRIRLNAGDVNGGAHAYVTYCREIDNQFVVLDWCYWYKDIPVKDRNLHRNERDYYGIWFSWNQKFAFGNSNAMFVKD